MLGACVWVDVHVGFLGVQSICDNHDSRYSCKGMCKQKIACTCMYQCSCLMPCWITFDACPRMQMAMANTCSLEHRNLYFFHVHASTLSTCTTFHACPHKNLEISSTVKNIAILISFMWLLVRLLTSCLQRPATRVILFKLKRVKNECIFVFIQLGGWRCIYLLTGAFPLLSTMDVHVHATLISENVNYHYNHNLSLSRLNMIDGDLNTQSYVRLDFTWLFKSDIHHRWASTLANDDNGCNP